jgi:transposase
LQHREEAEKFYRDLAAREKLVRVGMEASGHARWFERLLAELRFELWIGDAAEIRARRVRKQKTDRQDAQHILQLLVEDRFPQIWVPSWENRDLFFANYRARCLRISELSCQTKQTAKPSRPEARASTYISQTVGRPAPRPLPVSKSDPIKSPANQPTTVASRPLTREIRIARAILMLVHMVTHADAVVQ